MESERIVITSRERTRPKRQNVHPPYEYTKYELLPGTGKDGCRLSLYEIPPGKSNYPFHYHAQDREVFYILSGGGTLETSGGERAVAAGDVICCPPGEGGAHKLINTADEPLVYLDFDTLHDPDVFYYPHSNKIGVRSSADGPDRYFRMGEAVEYYDGE